VWRILEASMFLLKYLEVKEDEKEVLNIDFIGDREVDERPIFSTLILGENGTGKSFLLKTIVDIFIYISKAQIYKRKPKFKYSKFCVKYSIDGNEYCVKKESGRDIFCWKNGTEIVLDEIELPKKVLAVSFMVNDKFRFVKPGEDIGSIYKYLGVGQGTIGNTSARGTPKNN
jgi:energy-coupling factor transporter ATP-binding protein EcfA2